jgi:NAD(P)H-nitrite reductase large subunit
VDYRKDTEMPIVTLPYEVGNYAITKGDKIDAVDITGKSLGMMEVVQVMTGHKTKTQLIKIKAPAAIARLIAGMKIQSAAITAPLSKAIMPDKMPDDAMVCLCERVTAGEIRALIRQGVTDMNQIKAITRAGMGPCGAKTCDNLVKQVMREEGIALDMITAITKRPAYVEVPLGVYAGAEGGDDE